MAVKYHGGRRVEDLAGKVFGNLTVLRRDYDRENTSAYWVVRCSCGHQGSVLGSHLRRGRTYSCMRCAGLGRRAHIAGEIPATYWKQLERGALKRGFEFSITPEFAWGLFLRQRQKCALSGRPIGFRDDGGARSGRHKHTASLDRIDSTKGYTPDNVQWVHKTVNYMKQDLLEDEFISFCHSVAAHKNVSVSCSGL